MNDESRSYKQTQDRQENLIVGVVGLGYVGLPVAIAMAKQYYVIGFDINQHRISSLAQGVDITREVSPDELCQDQLKLTSNPNDLHEANFFIITVPTPIDECNSPDMSALFAATMTVAKALKAGDIVVYESTVYPGATEEECVPILQRISGLKYNKDFFVGYSPERINPGDKEHRFATILKVVSGSTPETLVKVASIYESVVKAGVYRASSIKVAEASKVIENTQRDLNVAFMNELSKIFHLMNINTKEVLEAAATKWNFLPFFPGLVGGHCIGVDPYYLAHQAQVLGYNPEVILAGRRINDDMGHYIAQCLIERLIEKKVDTRTAKINILGLTFKENCPDVRNTRVVDIYNKLKSIGFDIALHDPEAEADDIEEEYGCRPVTMEELPLCDALIIAVPHNVFRENDQKILKLLKSPKILFDLRGQFKHLADDPEALYWSL